MNAEPTSPALRRGGRHRLAHGALQPFAAQLEEIEVVFLRAAQRNVRPSDWMKAMPGTFSRLSRSSLVMNRSVPPAAAQAS